MAYKRVNPTEEALATARKEFISAWAQFRKETFWWRLESSQGLGQIDKEDVVGENVSISIIIFVHIVLLKQG